MCPPKIHQPDTPAGEAQGNQGLQTALSASRSPVAPTSCWEEGGEGRGGGRGSPWDEIALLRASVPAQSARTILAGPCGKLAEHLPLGCAGAGPLQGHRLPGGAPPPRVILRRALGPGHRFQKQSE